MIKGDNTESNCPDCVEVFARYIVKKGKRIYHPRGGVFHFFAKPKK